MEIPVANPFNPQSTSRPFRSWAEDWPADPADSVRLTGQMAAVPAGPTPDFIAWVANHSFPVATRPHPSP